MENQDVIEVGDIVKVIDYGKEYSSYTEAAEEMNLSYWRTNDDTLHYKCWYDRIKLRQKEALVVGRMKHRNRVNTILGIRFRNINKDGIQVYKDMVIGESGVKRIRRGLMTIFQDDELFTVE